MTESVRRKRTLRPAMLVCGVIALVLCQPAWSQTDGRRIYDEQLRVRLDQQIPGAKEMGLDAGGWFNFAVFNYNDTIARRTRTLRQFELRGWASVNIQGVHRAYVRGLVGWDDWNAGSNPTSGRGDEDTDPEIERAWYQFDLAQIHRNRTGKEPPVGFKVKVGREYAEIGTALVLSLPLDMIQFDLRANDWDVMAILGKTRSETANIDDSDAVATHMRRCIWGVEVAYNGFDRHRPFAYFLSNEDDTNARPFDPTQNYAYESRYVGIGSEGTVLLPNLSYQAELVGEWGKTYSEGVAAGRDNVQAWAADVVTEYIFERPTKPRVNFEYLYASGDGDRRSSATSTIGGNEAGSDDNAFNAFGFRDTGLSFAPRVSNLQMYALGASFFPLEKHELFKKMEVGTKVFAFQKADSHGPISDTDASKDSRWLGWEWDVFCDWRLTSDVTFTIRYGAFQPGAAFDNNSCRQFLYSALTFSF